MSYDHSMNDLSRNIDVNSRLERLENRGESGVGGYIAILAMAALYVWLLCFDGAEKINAAIDQRIDSRVEVRLESRLHEIEQWQAAHTVAIDESEQEKSE